VIETADATGQISRTGECLLGVWRSPLKESNTCSHWVQRGEFKSRPERRRPERRAGSRASTSSRANIRDEPLVLREDLLDMDEDAFRKVLTEVIRDELGLGDVAIAGKWDGGEVVLRPGKEGTQEKRIPLTTLFHKIVLIRDKLRVLEQRINSHPKLSPEEKVQLQQYVTGCYGSLTTFNVLFASREDQFTGQTSDD
jgi:hypothetical protein